MAASKATPLRARNGGAPAMSVCNIAPSAQTSVRGSASSGFRICSGATYGSESMNAAGAPRTAPSEEAARSDVDVIPEVLYLDARRLIGASREHRELPRFRPP